MRVAPFFAQLLGSLKIVVQFLRVAVFQAAFQFVQLLFLFADELQQAVAVGKGDVAPHFGAAGGDAGKIEKAAACEVEVVRALRVV